MFANQRELDPQREVHGKLQPLIDRLHDRARRRVVVVGLAAIDRVRRRERHHAGLGIDEPARQPEAVDIPRIHRLAAVLDPFLGRGDEVAGRHDGVDDFHALRLRDPDLVALEQELQRVARHHHARDALGAAGAGKQPDLDFGKADARFRIVGSDPVMAGEAQLEAAAERHTVDRRDPRLAAGFQPAIDLRQPAAFLKQPLRSQLLALLAGDVGKFPAQYFEHREVGAGAERILARRDDGALDRGVGGDLLDDRGELLHHLEVDDVHRAAGRIPGDERNAVGVGVELEMDHAHGSGLLRIRLA